MKAPFGLNVSNNIEGNRKFLLDMLPKHGVGAEIGVAIGNFSWSLLKASCPSILYLVDPWHFEPDAHKANRWYGGKGNSQEAFDKVHDFVVQRFMENCEICIKRQRSDEFLQQIDQESLDWIYIDGDHSYGPCLKDIAMSISRVKVGGLICGADYDWGAEHKFPVKQAVQTAIEMFADYIELTMIKNGQFVFRRIL